MVLCKKTCSHQWVVKFVRTLCVKPDDQATSQAVVNEEEARHQDGGKVTFRMRLHCVKATKSTAKTELRGTAYSLRRESLHSTCERLRVWADGLIFTITSSQDNETLITTSASHCVWSLRRFTMEASWLHEPERVEPVQVRLASNHHYGKVPWVTTPDTDSQAEQTHRSTPPSRRTRGTQISTFCWQSLWEFCPRGIIPTSKISAEFTNLHILSTYGLVESLKKSLLFRCTDPTIVREVETS